MDKCFSVLKKAKNDGGLEYKVDTTLFQVADMYNNQEQVKNQNSGGGKHTAEDDFDF